MAMFQGLHALFEIVGIALSGYSLYTYVSRDHINPQNLKLLTTLNSSTKSII